MSDALWQRWEGFLAKIAERQKEIFAEAEEGVREIIATYPLDLMPLGNALSGLRFRIDELRTKVDETWDKQVEPKFEEVGGAFHDRGLDRKADFLDELAHNWDDFEARMNVEFFHNLKPLADEGAHKTVNCGGCGAVLDLPTRSEAVTHKCKFCNAVNQVLAETACALWLGAGHAFGQQASLPLRRAVNQFRTEVDRWRRANSWAPEPVESMDKWLEMERACWEKYAEAAGATHGRAPDREFVESRVNQFVEFSLARDQRWRKAKGL